MTRLHIILFSIAAGPVVVGGLNWNLRLPAVLQRPDGSIYGLENWTKLEVAPPWWYLAQDQTASSLQRPDGGGLDYDPSNDDDEKKGRDVSHSTLSEIAHHDVKGGDEKGGEDDPAEQNGDTKADTCLPGCQLNFTGVGSYWLGGNGKAYNVGFVSITVFLTTVFILGNI